MDRSKAMGIQMWPDPHNIKDIQSFLGFGNFYQKFIHECSDITILLTNLTWKDTPWNFGVKGADIFQCLKDAFNTAPVLFHWAPDLPMTVKMDTFDFDIADILCLHPDDEICPVTFLSHSLQPTEHNYNTHNKELLTIIEAYKSWYHYLKGSTDVINMVTDHKNLEYFRTTKKLTHHQAHWSEFLS